jgi:hypothetical protein
LSEAEPTPGPADVPNIWGVLWLIGVVLLGLFLLLKGATTRPPTREALTVADHVGPLSYTTPLVRVSRGRRGTATYRTQIIPLSVPGLGYMQVSPPPTLWVDGIDQLRYGQRVEFRIDPHARMVFEATSGGRTLLSYAESEANRRSRSNGLILAGLFCLAVAGLHGFNMRKEG